MPNSYDSQLSVPVIRSLHNHTTAIYISRDKLMEEILYYQQLLDRVVHFYPRYIHAVGIALRIKIS